MLDWEIAEEGKPSGAQEERPARPRFYERLGWQVVLVALGFMLGFGGLLGWQAREREAALRTDLTRVVEGEARALAVQAREQVNGYLDQYAPVAWRAMYLAHSAPRPDVQGLPRLGAVRLEKEGQIARVEVVWTLLGMDDTAGREWTERRAYRLVNGAWRRTPYVRTDARVERRTEHFVWEAPSEEADALFSNPDFSREMEMLRQKVERQWPAAWFDPTRLTIRVVPQEFGPLQPTVRQRTVIQMNSPALASSDPLSVLPPDTQYRLALTQEVLYHLIRPEIPPISEERVLLYRTVYDYLIFTEARHQALTEEEQRAVREQWRKQLGGEWESPLSGPMFWMFGSIGADQEAIERRQVALHLLLEQLVEQDGPEVLGSTALAMTDQHPTEFDVQRLLVEVTGLSQQALEADAEAYALSVED